MRIVVMSDSHGRTDAVQRVLEQQKDAQLFIHLGDGLQEFHAVMAQHPEKEAWSVRGNCDFGSTEESLGSGFVRDKKILYTHGHQWNVKFTLDDLRELGQQRWADVVLYGHTHQPHYQYSDGMHLFNPGSLGSPKDGAEPTYGVIDMQGKSLVCTHLPLYPYPPLK